MNGPNNNRGSARRTEPPRRVQDAAGQMRNTGPQGTFRGYVPQPTGNQRPVQYAVPPQNPGWNGQRGAAMSPVPPKPKKKRKTGLIIFLTILALAGIAAAVVTGVRISKETAERQRISDKVSPYNGLFCPGVYVDGIALGGMTPEQAMNSVKSQINQRDDAWKVQLVYNGSIVANINTDTMNMRVDENELNNLMNNAWLQGHNGSEAERYTQMETLETTPYVVYTARPNGDTGEIDRILESLKGQIDQPAQDATVVSFDPSRTYPFIFTTETTGLRLDIAPLKEQLYQMVSTMTSGTVEIKPEVLYPQVTEADLQQQYALLYSATTPISSKSNEDRNNNIRRCFEKITGYILQPGKQFSFNKIVGDRTVENGFYPAEEYINDEHVMGIGGGACQASTTVYQAAVCSGLQIVSRRPHSDAVSYTDYGKDATVYMGGKQIDLVFKNNTDGPIYITADVVPDGTSKKRLMTKVSFWGRSLGNVRYTLETETVEILPSLMDPVYVSDKDSASKAKDGYVVKSYRVTYIDGVEVNREILFTDTYNPKPEKIYDPNR